MQRFTLIHDGSNQGWQAAYLSYHIAAQLGAPLLALLVDPQNDKKILAQRASEVETGGHAAGVVMETRLVTNFTVDILFDDIEPIDGLFIPQRFVPDEKTAARFLEAVSCPLWIVSKDAEINEMAVLVDDLTASEKLINYTFALSTRIQQSLTGLVRENELAFTPRTNAAISWLPLHDFSPPEITATLNQLDAGLLFIPVADIALISKLSVNCVIFPAV